MATLLDMLLAHCNSEMQRRGHRPKPAQVHRQSRENGDRAEAPYSVSAAALGLASLARASLRGPPPPGSPPPAPTGCTGSHSRPRSSRSRPRPPLTQFCALLLSLTFLHRLPGISMAAKRGCPAAEREPQNRSRAERPGAGRSRGRGGACARGSGRALTCSPRSELGVSAAWRAERSGRSGI